jgi:ribosomal protein L33
MKEANQVQCRICNELKTRIHSGYYVSKNKKFTDERGKLWSGRYCPDCNVKRSRGYMMKSKPESEDPNV